MGLDKTYQLQPMFTLIEARQTCDDAAYVDLCAKEYSNLADNDRGLLIINWRKDKPMSALALQG